MMAQTPVQVAQAGACPWGLYSPVDVADNGNRRADVHHVGLAHEHLLGLLAYLAQQRLVQQLFAQELLYAGVEVERSHGLGAGE